MDTPLIKATAHQNQLIKKRDDTRERLDKASSKETRNRRLLAENHELSSSSHDLKSVMSQYQDQKIRHEQEMAAEKQIQDEVQKQLSLAEENMSSTLARETTLKEQETQLNNYAVQIAQLEGNLRGAGMDRFKVKAPQSARGTDTTHANWNKEERLAELERLSVEQGDLYRQHMRLRLEAESNLSSGAWREEVNSLEGKLRSNTEKLQKKQDDFQRSVGEPLELIEGLHQALDDIQECEEQLEETAEAISKVKTSVKLMELVSHYQKSQRITVFSTDPSH